MSNYTPEQIQAAREYAAQNPRECAAHAFDPDFGFADHVTDDDKQLFRDKQLQHAEEIEAGKHDHNFTIWQRMHYYLTGECPALLP